MAKRDLQENPEPVVIEWMQKLPFQQQSVIIIGVRGPDGVGKYHPCKPVVRAYRATVLKAAYFGRELNRVDKADSFMDLTRFLSSQNWEDDVKAFFDNVDGLPGHFVSHLAHGAQILGYKHPNNLFRYNWNMFYDRWCEELHVEPESEIQMDNRLNDWNQVNWD